MVRAETRRQRYRRKLGDKILLPASFTTVCFNFDDNLAFLLRTAACFGFSHINVIGSIPARSKIDAKSGSLFDFIEIRQYPNPHAFMEMVRAEKIYLVSADLSPSADSLYEYKFKFDIHTSIVIGNETTGIPVEISINSDEVFIPMPGPGYCLNASQSGTVFAAEYSRQLFMHRPILKKEFSQVI